MTDSPTLFDAPAREVRDVPVGEWRRSDPLTSVEAAQKISGRTERLILAVMGETKDWSVPEDWTADELCDALPTVYPPTLVSALSRLKNHHLIVATGETRPSRRNCEQTVWRAS